MAQITVKYDPSLKIEEIEDPMYATSEEESNDRPAEVQQTKIVGILTPLIKVNKVNIMFDKVRRFELDSTGLLPTLTFTFKDDMGFIKSLDIPSNDNLVLLQILPPFDNAYKKINLRFFIESIKINKELITIVAKYNTPDLYQYQLKSFGNITSYDFLDKVATECKLGYASNIDGTQDAYYRYIRNTNYATAIANEIKHSGSETCILDTWVDFHNYLVVCDMYERFNAIDNDLKVWVAPTSIPQTETGTEIVPKEVDAIISNGVEYRNSQLYTTNYIALNSPGSSIKSGTDKVLESYSTNINESAGQLIQDGDIKKDTFIKSVYMGELFGDYDYFSAEVCRQAYMQKIYSNTIEVSLATPVLGLERGQRVNFKWYEANTVLQYVKKDNDIETNIPVDEDENEKALNSNGEDMILNKQVSGQYLIIGTKIQFLGFTKGWNYILMLARPNTNKNTYVQD